MKNLKVTIVLALGVALFASCKREYQCNCMDINYDTVVETIEARSTREAKSICKSMTVTPEGNTCTYKGMSQ